MKYPENLRKNSPKNSLSECEGGWINYFSILAYFVMQVGPGRIAGIPG